MVASREPVAIKVLRADLASALDSLRFLKQMRKAAISGTRASSRSSMRARRQGGSG